MIKNLKLLREEKRWVTSGIALKIGIMTKLSLWLRRKIGQCSRMALAYWQMCMTPIMYPL